MEASPAAPGRHRRCGHAGCVSCKTLSEYQARWHARVTRMYRWALAHAAAERAWASKRTLHRHAYAIACAEAREHGLTGEDASKSLRAWQEIYFEQPPVSEGLWFWDTADGPPTAF